MDFSITVEPMRCLLCLRPMFDSDGEMHECPSKEKLVVSLVGICGCVHSSESSEEKRCKKHRTKKPAR